MSVSKEMDHKAMKNVIENRHLYGMDFRLIFNRFDSCLGKETRQKVDLKMECKSDAQKKLWKTRNMSTTDWQELREELGRTLGER